MFPTFTRKKDLQVKNYTKMEFQCLSVVEAP